MKFCTSWLKEFVEYKVDATELAEQLTMVGLEVDSVKPAAKKIRGVVVGEILTVNPHPNADKLTLCEVDVGTSEHLAIVCGATNVRSNLKVPVAVVGAEIENFKIKKAKLRGVDSYGMMCSAVELGLAETSSGLLELPHDAPIGVDLSHYLFLDDVIIEIELTPDRGDCACMVGIAREVAAINRLQCKKIETEKIPGQDSVLPVIVTAKEACPNYCGRIIRDIDNKVNTPIWLQERLRRSGISSINPVVDVANYVMLELGQPLHGFDLEKLDKKIEVRYAQKGEELVLLNGDKVVLDDKILVIADQSKVLAMAGIIGGIDSGVLPETTNVFLESAFFTPRKIVGVARSYGLHTDASYRYERGVDYNLQLHALNRATALLLEIVGGKPSDVVAVTAAEYLPQPKTISLQRVNIAKVIGISISDQDVFAILSHLGMQAKPINEGWLVAVPSWRFDLEIEEDLIEEVARIYGFHHVPEQKMVAELIPPPVAADIPNKNRLYELMVDLGYHEIITYSFVDPKLQKIVDPIHEPLSLVNPISSELSVMRTSLWSGLIKAAKYNLDRQQQRARLFEIGLCFLQQNDNLEQIPTIGGIVIGNLYKDQWGVEEKEQGDFFDLKNDVNAIFKMLGYDSNVKYLPESHPALHPKRSAQIYVENSPVGFIGELHPMLKQKLELSQKAYLFEINLTNIINGLKGGFHDVSRYPKIKRDVALVIDKKITWQMVKEKIVDISGELLHNIELFDVYCGKSVDPDKKSMAIRLVFQSDDRTLVDTEVDALIEKMLSVLKQTFNATLRG